MLEISLNFIFISFRYFTFSLGDDETRFGFLGSPGNEQAIEDDKLQEFKDVMKGILP